MDHTTSPSGLTEVARKFEPLWIAALGVQLIAGGGILLPRLIRLMGRGGAVETVEWAVYMSMLFVFPVAVAIVGWVFPRLLGEGAASVVKRGLVLLVLVEFAVYVVAAGGIVPALAATAAAAAGTALLRLSSRYSVSSRTTLALITCCGVAGWMAGGGLIYWASAVRWLASPASAIVLLATTIIAATALRRWAMSDSSASAPIRVLDLVPLAALIAFSFRTNPMVEFYHWGFFVGPIEQLRQGGTLLWDTPSQYGFLSILLPTLLPGSAWQSFWFFQSVTYAIVASLMYLSMRRLSPGLPSAVIAFVFTFVALFFRPRSDSLMLPAQMTPAAGPFRFIWCFVMIAFLVRSISSGSVNQRRFALTGTVIWILAVVWSAETAIYVTAMWFPALLIHTLQSARSSSLGSLLANVLKVTIYPLGALALAFASVVGWYRIAGRSGPDISGHFEYVLLYSRGGFGALPIDPTGTIWYLTLIFFITSTVLVLHSLRNPRDSRLVVWAAAWGGVWAVSSYFTGRSHPVNLIALVPVLLYIAVAVMRMNPFASSSTGRYAMAAAVLPLIVMPVVATMGHREFPASVTAAQLSPAAFTRQVRPMDPELEALLTRAGAKPDDSFVLASDGRLMLGAWNTGGLLTLSSSSWLPKPFEIVGSLPEARRQVYFDRNAARFPRQGWLIESRTLEANGGDHLLEFAESSRSELMRFESANWIVRLMGPVR